MRYIILVLLNLPIIILALVNIVTQYKLGKVSKNRFKHQLLLWMIVLIVLIGSFPLYNIVSGRTLLDSSELSAFDIAQTTVIVILFYLANRQRQHIESIERKLRNLHQALSIKLSDND